VAREPYVLWLVQQHKYMRWTHGLLLDYASGLSQRSSAAPISTTAIKPITEEPIGRGRVAR
jgi:hypothetical protein